jgi:quinol monooxygenase YgiN
MDGPKFNHRTADMVNVIAAIRVKPGKRTKFLEIFKANIPSVIAEQGCIEYLPTVDLPANAAAADPRRRHSSKN